MAMHKSKKIKRFQPGGLIDTEGRPVRDGSNQPIMTGYGREEAETQKRMQAAEAKLAQDVQNKLKTDKAAKDDADFAEADRVSSTARAVAGKPAAKTTPAAKSGIVTKEELEKSGLSLRDYMNKQKGLTRRGSAVSKKDESTPVNRARYTPEDSTPRQYMSPSYMRNLMREDMEKARAEIQPQRREEQKAAQRNKAEPNKYTRPNEASSASSGSKFDANDALQTGVALASLYPAVRTGKTIYQAGKKAYQGYKATKTATTGAKSPLQEKTKELIQSDRTAKTKELSSKMAEKQTPTKFASKKSTSAAKKPVASKRTKKFNEDESGMDFKRGGSVSSRADGCAQRGKTRCKVY